MVIPTDYHYKSYITYNWYVRSREERSDIFFSQAKTGRYAMNNSGTILLKVVALTGGAVLGALLSRWVDDLLAKQAQSQSDHDKARYAQGLGPIASSPTDEQQK